MPLYVSAFSCRHQGLNICRIFLVADALLCCRVVVVSKLKHCRVPSSAAFPILNYFNRALSWYKDVYYYTYMFRTSWRSCCPRLRGKKRSSAMRTTTKMQEENWGGGSPVLGHVFGWIQLLGDIHLDFYESSHCFAYKSHFFIWHNFIWRRPFFSLFF